MHAAHMLRSSLCPHLENTLKGQRFTGCRICGSRGIHIPRRWVNKGRNMGSALIPISSGGQPPLLHRPRSLPGIDHVDDPVQTPVDVVADHHAGLPQAMSPPDPHSIPFRISGLIIPRGLAHLPLSELLSGYEVRVLREPPRDRPVRRSIDVRPERLARPAYTHGYYEESRQYPQVAGLRPICS